jgi:hypothetical protein
MPGIEKKIMADDIAIIGPLLEVSARRVDVGRVC